MAPADDCAPKLARRVDSPMVPIRGRPHAPPTHPL